jgi:hypothetical protein
MINPDLSLLNNSKYSLPYNINTALTTIRGIQWGEAVGKHGSATKWNDSRDVSKAVTLKRSSGTAIPLLPDIHTQTCGNQQVRISVTMDRLSSDSHYLLVIQVPMIFHWVSKEDLVIPTAVFLHKQEAQVHPCHRLASEDVIPLLRVSWNDDLIKHLNLVSNLG